MTLEQLRAELHHWQTKADIFGQLGHSRNRKEVLKRARLIKKAIRAKLASNN
jgi:hypothetical protein